MDGEGEGIAAIGEAGVGVTGVEGTELFFREDCLGGDCPRDVVCRPLVKSRETDAVAVDVPDIGATIGGDRREGLGRGGAEWVEEERGFRDDCEGDRCFSRICRRDSTVRSTWRVADSDEAEEVDSSSIGGVRGRG